MQDCLLKAFRSFDLLTDPEAASGWMTTILVNCCRDRGRSAVRQPDQVELEEADRFSLVRKVADEDPFPYSDSLHLVFLHQFGREDLPRRPAGTARDVPRAAGAGATTERGDTTMIRCSDAVRQLWQYLEGELPQQDRASG